MNKKQAQSVVEYVLLFALMGVVVISASTIMGDKTKNSVTSTTNLVESSSNNSKKQFCDAAGGTYDANTNECTTP